LRTEKGDEVVRRISKVETASTDTHYSMNGVKGGKTYL
jgi:predicted neutral ceramidase superfamily lipid hydrolase